MDSKLLPICGRLIQAVMVLDSVSELNATVEYHQESIEFRIFQYNNYREYKTIFKQSFYVSGELLQSKRHANPDKKLLELIILIEYITELEVDYLAKNGTASTTFGASGHALEADDIS